LPSSLTKDDSMMIDVVLFVLDYYKNKNIFFETSILLQPTSPLRDNFHIKEALSLYYKNNYNSLVSFSEIRDHPYKSFYLLENNKIKPLF
jgi:CMP-N-acetylneuraminic acid synthetase